MSRSQKRVVLLLKSVVALALIIGVSWHFWRLLTSAELRERELILRWEYLLPAGLLYLAAHTIWGTFFVQLLKSQGGHTSWIVGVRAYFVSQFGKYVPGKAWVIFLRMAMLRGQGLSPVAVGVNATYETLTSMAAGAALGVCLLPWSGVGFEAGSIEWLALAGIGGLPLILGVLNRTAARIARKRRGPDARPIPSPSLFLLTRGLLQDAVGWCLLGLSLWMTIQGVSPEPTALTGETYLQCLAAVTISYVIGFVFLVSPGGLGAREAVLLGMLSRQLRPALGESLASPLAAVIALVLRIVWTIFEVVFALALLWFARPVSPEETPALKTQDGGHND